MRLTLVESLLKSCCIYNSGSSDSYWNMVFTEFTELLIHNTRFLCKSHDLQAANTRFMPDANITKGQKENIPSIHPHSMAG